MHQTQQAQFIWIAVAFAVVARFAYRELRERKIRLARLFVVPIVLGVISLVLVALAASLATRELAALAAAIAVALGLGCAVGFGVARFTKLRVGEDPGIVYVHGSFVTFGIWLGAFALRAVARFDIGTHDAANAAVANAALIVLLATAITVVRYRILIEARIARARGMTAELTAI